ncbi:MAG TPA: phosphodiesterase [Gammaproteobacteria bacterium]|nr:phosphodiesterase [Gammaproteobacteria bacterium]
MTPIGQILSDNIRLLRTKATRHAVYGAVIAIAAVVTGTLLAAFVSDGVITVDGIVTAQRSNAALWFLDLMPFAFAFWGQYVSTVMAYEAGVMVADQTQDLRNRTAILEYQSRHNATHDALTALPNRVLLVDRLEQSLSNARREKHQVAVLVVNLDRFKDVNESLGNYQGDRLLKQVAGRLKQVMRASDTLARLGGDEFALILHQVAGLDDVRLVVKKIRKTLGNPYVLENHRVLVRASIGGALFPEHGDDPDALLHKSDVAMYVAKQEQSGFVLYSPSLDLQSPRRQALVSDLRDAIKNNELSLRYQPMVASPSYEVIDVEALVRWEHPQHGTLTPEHFIPLAERTGLIHPLTLWVIEHALQQQAEWRSIGLEVGMAVNISAQTLLDPEFVEQVTALLESNRVPPDRLTLEVTESSIMFDQELALHILGQFAEMGVRIAIDDFGTGYSSLAYLKKLPVSQLKIDRSFVLDMANNDNDAVIVHATIDLAHNLGLKVIAEGVENAEALGRLTQLGCDIIQGYHINYPIRGDSFPAWFYGPYWHNARSTTTPAASAG